MNIKRNEAIVFSIALIGIVIYSTVVNLYALPLTEGWYESIAWVSKDQGLYKDYYFALPPLFINIISLLDQVTGSLLGIRLIFTVFNLLQFITLAFLCKLVTRNTLASIVGAFIAQTYLFAYMPSWLSKDYHVLVSVLVNTVLILLTLGGSKEKLIYVTLAGVGTGLLLLTKQNVGAILALSVISAIIFNYKKYKISASLIYIISTLLLLLAYSTLFGYEWISTYVGNDSKGDIKKIIFRFILEKHIVYLIKDALIIASILAIVYFFKNILENNKVIKTFSINYEYLAIPTLIVLANILLNQSYTNSIYAYSIAVIIFTLILQIVKINLAEFTGINIVAIPCVGLFYAGTLTAGFNYVSLELLIAISITFIFTCYFNFFKLNFYSLSIFYIVLIFSFPLNRLNDYVYGWWDYRIGSIFQMNKKIEGIKYLNGINVDLTTKEIYENANRIVGSLPSNYSLLAYPNIPIFYRLFEKYPVIRFPVLWFDVVPSSFNSEILSDLKQKKPDIVIWFKPSLAVYRGHTNLIKRSSVVEEVDSYFIDQIKLGKYRIDYIKTIANKDVLKNTLKLENVVGLKSKEIILFDHQHQLIDYIDKNKYIVRDFDLYQFIILVRNQ